MVDTDIETEKKKHYASAGERTFEYDDSLPNLPIPQLEKTLNKYLDSVKPHVSASEYEATKKIVLDFQEGIGELLQFKLLERSKHKRNWLEEWWEKTIYLDSRMPIVPLMNLSGCFSISGMDSKNEKYIERVSLLIHYYLCYWKSLRKEIISPQKFKDLHFSMHQWKRLFSCCRVPGLLTDRFAEFFKTESEDDKVPIHISVMHHGHIFIFDAIYKDGEPLTPHEIASQFSYITNYCRNLPYGSSLGALTCDERSSWYKNREHLIALSPENEHLLHLIESSMFTVVLDERSPATENQVFLETIGGDVKNRWADKSLQVICFPNGAITNNGDHAPFDAMALVALNHFALLGLLENDCRLQGNPSVRYLENPQHLNFLIDNIIAQKIQDAERLAITHISNLEVTRQCFHAFGKHFITRHNKHPDTFVQLALQLAYYRLHQRPAPTYETASTRQFYHGRTETLRSCTPEAIEWVKSMLNPSLDNKKKIALMDEAFKKHNLLMQEGMKNEGCDRHLYGLYLTAIEENLPIPELFLDPSYSKSGGNGNFILSTSLTGYTVAQGGVAPMCENGYGVFYTIQKYRLLILITGWKMSSETDTEKFYSSLSTSLLEMKHLLLSSNL